MKIIPLTPGEVYHHSKISEAFGGQTEGGMRRSKTSNTLHLIINHTASPYEDEWDGDILHYSGMGRKGNQNINKIIP